MADPSRQTERDHMVTDQIVARGIRDPGVIAAMRQVPRHRFVPDSYAQFAYADSPLPIGHGQTISQPFIVAFMTEALALQGREKVLEIGTGSGYQAAVLAELASRVLTIEIVEPLAREVAGRLAELGYANVTVRTGDGHRGWPEDAPFDAIIVTAATDQVPPPLLTQLAIGGRLILPLGDSFQKLTLYRPPKTGTNGPIWSLCASCPCSVRTARRGRVSRDRRAGQTAIEKTDMLYLGHGEADHEDCNSYGVLRSGGIQRGGRSGFRLR